jgi:cytochrome c oxidase assembly protein subunit 15
VAANIVSGAAVRLSGSGLGCPDWPRCTATSLTPPASLHAIVEFSNRVVVVLVVAMVAVTLVSALSRLPKRADLVWLAGGLAAGIVGEVFVGAAVVYSHLNPYVVASHFLLGMAMLADAMVLALRAGHAGGRGEPIVPPGVARIARVLLVALAAVLVAGTGTTGSGPHAGGPGARRFGVPFTEMARAHSTVVWAAGAVLLAFLWSLYRSRAPGGLLRRARILLAVLAAQGVVGYAQYFLHVPPILVGMHVAGAATVWCAAIWTYHGLFYHRTETAGAPTMSPAGRARIR